LWTCRRIRTVIQSKFGINYHPHHMCRLVRSLGWTPQRPERKAVERDEKLIQIWVNRDWRRIKKKLKD
jgi:transposase